MADLRCVACGADEWREVGPAIGRSILSDGKVMSRPLERVQCERCGLARHRRPLGAADVAKFYDSDYALYDQPAGGRFEEVRQQRYADWLIDAFDLRSARSIFEIGCGNGSLMRALRGRLPDLRFGGVEPAPVAAGHARSIGFDVTIGGYQDVDQASGWDMVVFVNVIEHVSDPADLLAAAARLLNPGGRIIFVHPDGERPSSELLFLDHLQSFSRASIAALAGRCGVWLERSAQAPAELGPFVGHSVRAVPVRWSDGWPSADGLLGRRRQIIEAWSALDDRLTARCVDCDRLICFGSGEAAQMLRAFAPRVWRRLSGYVTDTGGGALDGQPVGRLDEIAPGGDLGLIVATREDTQPALAARLAGLGHRPIVWADLVAISSQGKSA
jgi:SAM-dependent methyltransferase